MKKIIAKIFLLNLFLLGTGITVHCQVFMKQAKIVTKPITKKEPVITSPLPGSEISGPFVLVGKAEPNATVTIIVTPKNTYPPNTSGRPRLLMGSAAYKAQTFTVTANAKGFWQTEMIEVKFNTDAKDKTIQVFTSQEWDAAKSTGKTVVYKTPGMIMIMAPGKILSTFNIKSPAAGSIVKEDSRISGTAKAGAVVKVMIHSGYYPVGGGGPRAGEKQQLYATAGNDGKWETDVANFNIITEPYSNSNYDIVATVENSSEEKKISVLHPAESSVATSAFRVTSHKATTMVSNGTFKIKGVARAGSQILIERRFTGTNTHRYNASLPSPDIVTITNKKDADFGTLNATADQNGEWWVNCNMRKSHPTPESAMTDIDQATTMTVKISLVDGNGKKLKTESLVFLWNLK